jgi:hypothetical protein
MYVSLLVMIMSFTVSYARSRGETLGVRGAEGLMQRAERITILGMSLAFAPFIGHRMEGLVPHPLYAVTAVALCLLAILNTTTAIARIRWTMSQLEVEVEVQEAPAPRVAATPPASVISLASPT